MPENGRTKNQIISLEVRGIMQVIVGVLFLLGAVIVFRDGSLLLGSLFLVIALAGFAGMLRR